MNLTRSIAFSLVAGILGALPTLAQPVSSPVLTVPLSRAQGLSGSVVQVRVYPGSGQTVINFRPTGERIRQVTLGDSSKVILNSDDPECLAPLQGSDRPCQATVLYLKRIKLPPQVQNSLVASGLPTASKTRLTVLTDNENPYIFEIVYADGEPEYSIVAIKPEVKVTQNTRPNTLATAVTDVNRLEVLDRGYQVALSHKTVPLELSTRIRKFLSLMQSGTRVEQAASESGISMQVVFKLAELGSSALQPQPISIPWVQNSINQ